MKRSISSKSVVFTLALALGMCAGSADLASAAGGDVMSAKRAELERSLKAARPVEVEAVIGSFIEENRGELPLIEDSLITFVYSGRVALRASVPSDINRWDVKAHEMERLGGADLYYLTVSLPMDARVDYKLYVDQLWMLDPLNDETVLGGFGPNSAFGMPLYMPLAEIEYVDTIGHGTIEEHEFTSKIIPTTRKIYAVLAGGMTKAEAIAYPEKQTGITRPRPRRRREYKDKGRAKIVKPERSYAARNRQEADNGVVKAGSPPFELYMAFLKDVCRPLYGTPGAEYLAGRGIAVDVADRCGVRYCSDLSGLWTLTDRNTIKAVGLPGWSHWKDAWTRDFIGKDVVLVLDADPAGQKGAGDIAKRFIRAGLPCPRQLILADGKDLNDVLQDCMKDGKAERMTS